MLFHLLENHMVLMHYVAEKIKQALDDAIQKKGHALLVLPGGETPRALYTVLSEMEIPWQQVTLFLTDERWVDVSSPESNSYWIRKLLLHHAEGLVEFINYKTLDDQSQDAIENINQQMHTYPEPFDFVLLGMGGDGHVASLFLPSAFSEGVNHPLKNIYREMTQAGSDVIAVQAPIEPYERVSLSFSRLCHAHALAVLMTGATKWQQLQASTQRAFSTEDTPSTAIEYLVRHSQPKTPVQIFWAP